MNGIPRADKHICFVEKLRWLMLCDQIRIPSQLVKQSDRNPYSRCGTFLVTWKSQDEEIVWKWRSEGRCHMCRAGSCLIYWCYLLYYYFPPPVLAPSFYMITLNARATVGHRGPQRATAAENNEKISLTSEPWAASADTLLFSGKP